MRLKIFIAAIFVFALLSRALCQNVAIAALEMNVLYIGVDNPVRIAAENVPSKDLIVEISEGKITAQNDDHGLYNVYVTSPGIVVIRVRQKLSKDRSKLISEQRFRVKRIPDPVATLGGIFRGGAVSFSAISKARGIVPILANIDFNGGFTVTRFRVLACQNGDINEVENEGAMFNKKVHNLIDSAKPGDAIYFEDIVIVSPDGGARRIGPLRFMIDGYISHGCDPGQVHLPFQPVFETLDSTTGLTSTFLNCSCQCIDQAIGKYDNNRKSGWWIYNKVNDAGTTLVRKEFYSGDTVLQMFYANNKLIKQRSFVNDRLYGNYMEYYANGNIKMEGIYAIDTTGIDTIEQVNPVTLEEEPVIQFETRTTETGEWKHYNEEGKLYLREVFNKGKRVKIENY